MTARAGLLAVLVVALLAVLPAPASARVLADPETGFAVTAPRDFRLRVDAASGTYTLRSARRRAEVTYRRFTTSLAPAQAASALGGVGARVSAAPQGRAVLRLPGGRRAEVRRAGRDSVALTTWARRSAQRTIRVRSLQRIARSARHGIARPLASPPAGQTRPAVPAGAAAPQAGAPAPAPPISRATQLWSGDLAGSSTPCGFAQAGWDPYSGGGDYPDCPTSVRIDSAAAAGIPAPPSGGSRVGHFEVTPADAQATPPRYHAKLYKPFYAPGYSDRERHQHATRSPADVSGTYRAWYFLPLSYRIPGTGWRNIMQFKERHWDGRQSGYQSVPTWWLVLSDGDGRGTPYAGVNYWNGGNAGGAGEAVVFPRGRWVEVKAVIRQGESIEWWVDGRRIATGANSTWTVGPSHGERSLAWNFGVGNYAGAGGSGRWQDRVSGAPLYIAGAEYTQ